MASAAPPQQALELVPPSGYERRFVVARNPDVESSLPYVLTVPVGRGLVLKASEPWPLSSRVYCHPLEAPLGELDVVQSVGVRMCAWRGSALDLVLDRARHNRSQFVFTTAHGRAAIFWQTPLVSRRRRVRPPRSGAPAGAGTMAIDVDTRERRPYDFGGRALDVRRVALFAGDYAVRGPTGVVAAVERKTADDFVTSATSGALAFAMADLSALPCAAVVIEASYSQLIAHPRVRPGFMADLIARLQVRTPSVPLVYADDRRLAEDWTYRFLAAAWMQNGGATPGAMS